MEVTEKDVTDFEPLYNISGVDPDALDEIFRPSTNDAGRDCRVTFQYYDYEIIVRSHGRIVIQSGDQQD
jgi:predicted ATP-dependent protease